MANYDATINVRVSGTQALDGVFKRVEQLEGLVRNINAKPLNLASTQGWAKVADRFGEAAKELNGLKNAFVNSERSIEAFNSTSGRTIASARAIADGFKFIASNSSVTTNQFREFTLAAAQAGAAANVLGRQRLRVLNEELTGVNKADKTIGGRGVVASIISSGKELTNSIAALSAYKNELEDTLNLVEIGGTEFRALEEAITGVEQRLASAKLAGQKTALTPAAGPATRIDTVAAFEKKASYAKQIADLEYKQLVTGQQIVQAKLEETQQQDLLNRLAQASDALQSNELDTAKRITAELRNQRIAYERANRTQAALMRPTSMTAGAVESVTGKRPGGLPPVPGSPAAWMATGGVQTPATKAETNNLENQASILKRIGNITASTQMLEQKALQYKAKGLQVDHEINHIQTLIQRLKENGVNMTKAEVEQIDLVINGLRNTLLLHKAVAATRKAEAKGVPSADGAPNASKKRKDGTGFQNALIGGAFPLLFGGGPGAVIGGFAGGFIPGNPMMSIVTSAVGTMFDAFMTKTLELGTALNNTATIFDSLKERSLISNTQREKEIQLLQDAGFAATANAVAQEELTKIIGTGGVESLRQLGTETDRLNRTWAELSVQLQAVIAGPLADLAAKLNEFFRPKAVAGRVTALREDLAPQQRAALNRELRALGGPGSQRFGARTKGLNQVEIELAAVRFPEKVQALLDKYGAMRVETNIKFDPKQVREQTVNIIQKQLEVLDISEKFSAASKKQQELDSQRYALIRDYEESIASIRRKVEDEVTAKRLSLIQKENELLDIQAQIRQESFGIANIQAQRTAGAELPTAARDVARQAAEAAGSFQEQELSLAEQSAKLKRDSALEALRTDIQAAKFQADTAREVNKLNIDTAKRVAEINASVRKQNSQQEQQRFALEQKLAIIKLQTIEQEFEVLRKKATISRDKELAIYVGYAILDMRKALKEVQQAKPPAALKAVGGVGGQGVSFEGVNTLNKQLKEAEANIDAAQQALNDLLQLRNEETFKTKMQSIAESIDAPLQTLNEDMAASQLDRERYAELIKKGVRGVVAERLVEIEKLKDTAILQYDAVIAELEKKLAVEGTNKALEDQIDKLKKRRDAIEGKAEDAAGAVKKKESPAKRLEDAITAARGELTDLTDPINQVTAGAKAIGTAFQQAFTGLVSGAMTAQEALAAFFKGVGEHFLDMASMMIAKLIEIWILETVLGMIGGAASGAAAPSTSTGFGAGDTSHWGNIQNLPMLKLPGAANGAYWPGGFQAFADGGVVTRPTMGMIGEGGQPEYVIPASKMRGAMNRYAAGARGSAVIPAGSDGGDGMTSAAPGAPAAIDVRYTVERINSVDYVTADQFQRGMQQAASQGAAEGQRQTLRRLQNSPSTRRRIGV